MKRDIDLLRQLLLDIEAEAAECPITRLRATVATEVVDESTDVVRYHLRLLIDAGFVKEIDRTSTGVPCVRLTSSGHELLELSRSETRWQDAKRYTRNATGGLSLTVVRAVLTKWAVEGATTGYRGHYRTRRGYRPNYLGFKPRRRFDYREPMVVDPAVEDEDIRLVRTAPDYRQRWDYLNGYERDFVASPERYDYGDLRAEQDVEVSLPVYLV